MTRLLPCMAILLFAGCGDQPGRNSDSELDPSLPEVVRTAIGVLEAVEADPGKADSVLAARGLTVAGFDSLMYRISADSALRAAFASARR